MGDPSTDWWGHSHSVKGRLSYLRPGKWKLPAWSGLPFVQRKPSFPLNNLEKLTYEAFISRFILFKDYLNHMMNLASKRYFLYVTNNQALKRENSVKIKRRLALLWKSLISNHFGILLNWLLTLFPSLNWQQLGTQAIKLIPKPVTTTAHAASHMHSLRGT